MNFTKQQVEFIQLAFKSLIGERRFVECSWYAYKSHSSPIEIQILTLKPEGVQFFEYDHEPGSYGFNIGTSYGVTGCPDGFKNFHIDADHRTIHFKYTSTSEIVDRSFRPIDDDDSDWHLWNEFMRESWKLNNV